MCILVQLVTVALLPVDIELWMKIWCWLPFVFLVQHCASARAVQLCANEKFPILIEHNSMTRWRIVSYHTETAQALKPIADCLLRYRLKALSIPSLDFQDSDQFDLLDDEEDMHLTELTVLNDSYADDIHIGETPDITGHMHHKCCWQHLFASHPCWIDSIMINSKHKVYSKLANTA